MARAKRRVGTGGYGSEADEAASDPERVAAGPSGARPADGQRRQLAQLVRTVEVEVIPRLVLARRAAPRPAGEAGGPVPEPGEVEELTRLLLAPDPDAVPRFVEGVRLRGVPVEALYLDLLAPAACRLGDLWTDDLSSFTDVTLALGRLQRVLRDLVPAFRNEAARPAHGRRALLVPLPGGQHTFGLHMVAEFFRRSGWDVWDGTVTSGGDLVGVVRDGWFAVVGLSVGAECQLDGLASSIRAVRRASRNRAIGVLVGGPPFVERPELVALVGADATAIDGRQAALQAENLLALLPRHG